MEKSYFGELSLVVTHGHSWSLACTVRQNPIQEPNLVHWIRFIQSSASVSIKNGSAVFST